MGTVLHIGYHKTASTTLQRAFFRKLEGCSYVFHGGAASRSMFRTLSDHLMKADDGDYLESTVTTYFSELHDRSPGTLLVSHESYSGAVFDGSPNRFRNAERLARAVPDPRVLVVVRHQGHMLRSLYSQHLRHGGYSTFPDFLASRVEGSDVIDLDHLRYEQLIERYHDLLGADRVKVLAYEQLVVDPPSFLREIAEYVGSPLPTDIDNLSTIGPSLSAPARWLVRHSNRMFWRTRINRTPSVMPLKSAEDFARILYFRVDPKLFAGARRGLPPADEDLLARTVERYRDSNERLVELTGLPLAGYGYPLPATRVSSSPT